ncbi:MAG: hypothetical protein J5798_13885 [Spirochaetaceae bacterium]|nr:hypothetical protein [Spirochaetaceae bacterium]
MNKYSLIACISNDYTIQLDGKPFKVKGERLVGTFLESGWQLEATDETPYFRGAVFDRLKDGYDLGGTVLLSKKEFLSRVKTWTEIF